MLGPSSSSDTIGVDAESPILRPLSRETTPPGGRLELLAATDARGRALYGLVRQFVDELEEAAPWTLLYSPPLDCGDLSARIGRLLELVQESPQRIAHELNDLTASGTRFGREAREEAEFYFAALHQMTAPNRRLLAAALAKATAESPVSRSGSDELSELAADLKGEFSSAMMGAAAALVSDGRWLGVEVESILFPEKAEERRCNRRLLAALKETDQALDFVRTEFPWRPILESWKAHHPVDRYALSALVSVRSHLLTLLSAANRRALFSGDYRLLKRREIPLGSRLRELEELHLGSLDLATDTREENGARIYARLGQLLFEVSAILDIETLRDLIGSDAVHRLRAEGAHASHSHPTGRALDPLAQLVGEEDLTIFLQLLLGAVTKRLSIAFEAGEVAAPHLEALVPEASPEPAAGGHGALDPLQFARQGRSRIHDQLATVLARLLHPAHEPWRAFQMVHKLQSRLRVLPPTLTAEMLPFLGHLRTELLPVLEEAAAFGVLPTTAADTLRSCERNLSGRDLSRPATSVEVGNDLGRVIRLLHSLESALTAMPEGASHPGGRAREPIP